MTANQMLRLMNRTPFEPMEIHLNNGTKIKMENPYQIATAPNSATCAVYPDDDELMRIVAFRNVAEVITARGAEN
jgi:hypothetical protein